jgi:hypothetical protein
LWPERPQRAQTMWVYGAGVSTLVIYRWHRKQMKTIWTDLCKESEPVMKIYQWNSQQSKKNLLKSKTRRRREAFALWLLIPVTHCWTNAWN